MMAEIRSRERFACYYFYYALLSSISYLGALYLTWNHLFPTAPGGNIHNILNFQHNQPAPVLARDLSALSCFSIRGEPLIGFVQPSPSYWAHSQDKCGSVTISTPTLITICYSPLPEHPSLSPSHSVGSFHFWHKQ